MKKVSKNEENKKIKIEKKEKSSKIRVKKGLLKSPLLVTLYILMITIISLISVLGIYVKDKNKMANLLPDYILGTDISGSRNITIKVDSSTEESDTNETTLDNYKECKEIIEERLKALKVQYYELKFDEATGNISIEVPENTESDNIAQYCITKGEFKISDKDSSEVLLNNSNIKEAKVQYNTEKVGTTVYLTIQFNKDSEKKLNDISKEYVQSKDADGNDTTKEISMTLDDSTIMTTYFNEEMKDGIIQLSLGTSSDSNTIQSYLKNASNMAVLLNTKPMPLTYVMEKNSYIYSDITENALKNAIIVVSGAFVVLLIYMIIKYNMLGLIGAFTNIGLLAILLIVIRYTNISVTLTGMMGVVITTLIEYVTLMSIFKTNKKDLDKETKEKEIKNTIYRQMEKLVPVAIIAITFALTSWETLVSIGTILFWGIIISLIYNFITLKIIFGKKRG